MNDDITPTDPVILEAYERAKASASEAAVANIEGWSWSANHHKYTPIEQVVLYALLERAPWTGLEFAAQAQIGRYTADFIVSLFNDNQKVVVECDGHEFHERTKEQAQHDKRRDREMQALGFKVYRFTGSEIWKTRGRCVTDALGLN